MSDETEQNSNVTNQGKQKQVVYLTEDTEIMLFEVLQKVDKWLDLQMELTSKQLESWKQVQIGHHENSVLSSSDPGPEQVPESDSISVEPIYSEATSIVDLNADVEKVRLTVLRQDRMVGLIDENIGDLEGLLEKMPCKGDCYKCPLDETNTGDQVEQCLKDAVVILKLPETMLQFDVTTETEAVEEEVAK